MRKVFIALVLLVFVFGCSQGNGSGLFGGNKDKKSVRYGFGSTSGLSISFAEDSPPKEVSLGRSIFFTLNVKNTGTFTVPSGSFMARLIGLDNNFNPSELEGSNTNDLAEVDDSGIGGESSVELGSTSYSPEQMFDDRIIKSGDLQVEVCYPYETQVVADNFWIGAKTSDVSKGSISQGDNSNAPVQVKELEERGSGGGKDGTGYTDFSFTIKVVGKGSVVSNCFPANDDDKKRAVNLKIFEREISCYYEDSGERKEIGSEGIVVLNSNNEKIVRCRIPFTGEKPIKSQLQIRLDYLYFDKVSVPGIKIIRV